MVKVFAIIQAERAAALMAARDSSIGSPAQINGFNNVGLWHSWIAVLASGTEAGFAMLSAMAGPGAIILATCTESDEEFWPELDQTMDTETLTTLNAWLTARGEDVLATDTRRALIQSLFVKFEPYFDINSAYIA